MFPLVEANHRHPFVDEARILPGAQVTEIIDPAREDEVTYCPATPIKTYFQTLAASDIISNRTERPVFLLDDRRPIAKCPCAHQVAYSHLDQIAATQLAAAGEIEQCAIAQTFVIVEIKTDRPDIARLEWTLGPNVDACIPGTPVVHGGVESECPMMFLRSRNGQREYSPHAKPP